MQKKLVLGLTGGIASGKSTVLNIFREFGAQTKSADVLAKKMLFKGEPAYHRVIERFGGQIVNSDGEIDRIVLGDIVFNDANAIKDLNNIIHPQVIEDIKESIDNFRKEGSGVFVAEIPLLFECGLENIVDKVIVVCAEQETQINRLKKRFGFTREQAESRI